MFRPKPNMNSQGCSGCLIIFIGLIMAIVLLVIYVNDTSKTHWSNDEFNDEKPKIIYPGDLNPNNWVDPTYRVSPDRWFHY